VAASRSEVAKLRAELKAVRSRESELQRSRDYYQQLFHGAPVAHLVLTGAGRVIDVNLAAARLFARPSGQILNYPLALFIAAPARQALFQHLLRARKERDVVVSQLGIVLPDLKIVPVELVTAPPDAGADNGTPTYRAALISLVKRRAAQNALRLSEERLRLALRAAQAGTWTIDLTTGAAEWSEGLTPHLGAPPFGRTATITDLLARFAPRERARARRSIDRIVSGESENFSGEFPVPSEGKTSWLAMLGCVTPFLHFGQELVGIAMDITARKEAEQALLKSRATLEQRVKERTAALQTAKSQLEKEMTDRLALERRIMEVSEQEQRRIGQDLHDGLGQQITGIILHAHLLQRQLSGKGLEEAGRAGDLVTLLNKAQLQARQIARGLQPVEPETNGLMAGLDHFAASASDLYRLDCRFVCPEPVLIGEHVVATHLFRIAQEAVANAFRHGSARKIEIRLDRRAGRIELHISDNGRVRRKQSSSRIGLGLQFMRYRAETIGGVLDAHPRRNGGFVVHCSVPETPSESPSK
jgi:signal transduction histidine kinase